MGKTWPVLTRYDSDHLGRIALPLGGIGTGTVSLGGRGDLRDWEVMNRPAKGFVPAAPRECGRSPFFAVRVQPQGRPPIARALEGPLPLEAYEGEEGSTAPNHGLPRFRNATFAAAYPFGQVMLSDPEMPIDARIEAFNPLIPGDADSSGIPAAILRFVLKNKTSRVLDATVCGNVPNFIGVAPASVQDAAAPATANRNTFRKNRRMQGIFMRSDGVSQNAERWGTMALTTTARTGVTYRTAWAKLPWGDSTLDFWDDFTADGELENRATGGVDMPMASLAVNFRIPPRATREVTFLLTWHFPNRMTWTPSKTSRDRRGDATMDRIGNYYTTHYRDAWDVATRLATALRSLEAETVTFVRAFCESDLPHVVKEAALFNLSTLRTQTCFRTEDGRFFGFEGCGNTKGSCPGSCTHVWNYEQATAFLFGDLARSMREIEFLHATDEKGLMSFRVRLPLDRAAEQGKAAADGQMGCIMKLYRDWQLSGNDKMLRKLWPKARKCIEFCWVPRGWDADRDGVMEGCQHNTMDVEYYGPNPQMGAWYLGALRAAEEMAKHLGEINFARNCRSLFERGSRWIDRHLFNGDYYEHEVRPPTRKSALADCFRAGGGAQNLKDPEFQLGAGCLIDQFVGQFMAHICRLGYLLNRKHIRRSLKSIMKYNFRRNLHGHFNNLRSYALGDESALLMATYPKGRRPKRPFPYYNEVMTGFEYVAAVHMLYEGQTENGLKCIANVRSRYDGRKRSPFNEAECGHHYVRAMASWAAVLALTGFHWSAREGSIEFAASKKPSCFFWSNGYAWGTCTQTPHRGGAKVELAVTHGLLKITRLSLTGLGVVALPKPKIIRKGRKAVFNVAL